MEEIKRAVAAFASQDFGPPRYYAFKRFSPRRRSFPPDAPGPGRAHRRASSAFAAREPRATSAGAQRPEDGTRSSRGVERGAPSRARTRTHGRREGDDTRLPEVVRGRGEAGSKYQPPSAPSTPYRDTSLSSSRPSASFMDETCPEPLDRALRVNLTVNFNRTLRLARREPNLDEAAPRFRKCARASAETRPTRGERAIRRATVYELAYFWCRFLLGPPIAMRPVKIASEIITADCVRARAELRGSGVNPIPRLPSHPGVSIFISI
ncbi:hypothetical protein KM043_003119 [Ampulex compressa]|nr:hypothetical protein KM043_003119 [Ampulex compressa]